MSVPYKPSQASLMLASKAIAYRNEGVPLYDQLLALPASIRLGWNCLPGTNTLAYYEHT
jgi:hypothetical protein